MKHLLAPLSAILLAIGPAQAQPRLTPHTLVDSFGFERPVEAYTLSLPVGWSMKGAVQWYGAASCPMEGPKPSFVSHRPDGQERMEFIPGGAWVWMSIYQFMPQMQQQAECRPVPVLDIESFLGGYIPTIRPNAQIVSQRRRPDLSQQAYRDMPNQNLQPGQQLRVETAEVQIAYESGGKRVRETLLTQITFIDQPGPDPYGGMGGRMTLGMTSGTLSHLVVDGEPDPALLAAVLDTLDINPQYTARMEQYYRQRLQFMQQAHARKRAAQQQWLASRRAAAAAASSSSSSGWVDTSGSDILDMQHEGFRSRSAMNDAGQARAVDGTLERAPWATTGGQTVYMPQQYQRVFQLPNDVYVGTNDPFFNPVQDTGQFGAELSPQPY